MSNYNFEQQERRSQANIKMIYGFAMGILWSLVGLFLVFHRMLGFELGYSKLFTYIFGGTCILYGGFRLWRGIKSKSEL
jgi:hypothetical protein